MDDNQTNDQKKGDLDQSKVDNILKIEEGKNDQVTQNEPISLNNSDDIAQPSVESSNSVNEIVEKKDAKPGESSPSGDMQDAGQSQSQPNEATQTNDRDKAIQPSSQPQDAINEAEQKKKDALEWKENQKKVMASFKVGAEAPSGGKIKRIFAFSSEWKVYEIETTVLSDSIKVYFHTIIREDNKDVENYGKVRKEFAELKGLLYKVDDIDTLKSRIGHILPQAITGDTDGAKAAFIALKDEINKRYKELFSFRMTFLLTALSITIFSMCVSMAFYYFNFLSDHYLIRTIVYAISGGSIGGFISVSSKLRNTSFESEVNKAWYIFYGIQRMMIAMVFGLIVYLAIETNTVFGFVNQLSKPMYGYVLFSVVAGFSETLIPNLLVKLEQSGDKDSKSK